MSAQMPSHLLHPGDVLGGKYELEAELGRGGMGVVYRARHRQLGGLVAIKVLLSEDPSAKAKARFEREMRMAMRLRGEHLVRLLDGGSDGEHLFFVMEYLEGKDLQRRLQEGGPLSCEEVVGYALQACEALAEAHSLGIVHRDLKPANLFLTTRFDGSPLLKILDFGVAKAFDEDPSPGSLTASSVSIGTPLYMAPEQIRDAKRVGAPADLWALGASLFELWTGVTPFWADTAQGLLASILGDEPRAVRQLRPDTPEQLALALERCLVRSPEQRLQSASELAVMLEPLAPSWAASSVARCLASRQSAPALSPQEVRDLPALSPGVFSQTEAGSLASDIQEHALASPPVSASRGRWVRLGVGLGGLAVGAGLLWGNRPPSSLDPHAVAAPAQSLSSQVSSALPSAEPPALSAPTGAVAGTTKPLGSGAGVGSTVSAAGAVPSAPRRLPGKAPTKDPRAQSAVEQAIENRD